MHVARPVRVAGVVPKLATVPKRWLRAGSLTWEAFGALAFRSPFGASTQRSISDRALVCAWLAENLCAVRGVQVVCERDAPSTPAIIEMSNCEAIDVVAVASLLRCIPVIEHSLGRWRWFRGALGSFGTVVSNTEQANAVRDELRAAVRENTSVLLVRDRSDASNSCLHALTSQAVLQHVPRYVAHTRSVPCSTATSAATGDAAAPLGDDAPLCVAVRFEPVDPHRAEEYRSCARSTDRFPSA